jgi:hypothetical protein
MNSTRGGFPSLSSSEPVQILEPFPDGTRRRGRRHAPKEEEAMKTLVGIAISLFVLVAGASDAPALEVKDKAKAPVGWWELKAPTAIPPQYFDQILSAYGLTLMDAGKAPPTYARKVGDKVVWEMAPRTYTPREMDQILSAYGATLDTAKTPPTTYAKVADGKPVFQNDTIAWTPDLINAILAAYR